MMNTSLNIQFLGTGTSQGIPVIGSNNPVCLSSNPKDQRLRSSVLISKNHKNILIDCGPDFRQQMLRSKTNSIEAILFTHEHNDHVMGLDDIRPLVLHAQKPMDLYASSRVLNEIKGRFPYVFSTDKYPGVPSVNLHTIEESTFNIGEFSIEVLPITHGKLPINGYIIDQKIAYITDASFISDEVKQKLQKIPVLVLNALRKEIEHPTHFILPQALTIAHEVNAQRAYFTHISNKMGFHDEVQASLPPQRFLAYDTLTVEI